MAYGMFVFQTFLGCLLVLIGNVGGYALAVSGLCMVVVMTPAVLKLVPFDVFSPLFLFAGSLMLGTGLRVPYLLFSNSPRVEHLMWGQSFYDLNMSLILVLIGIVAFTVGYCFPQQRFALERVPVIAADEVNRSRMLWASIFFGILGCISGYVFLKSAGINLSNGLGAASRKVFVTHVVDGEVVASTGGLPRFLVRLAEIPMIFMICMIAARRTRTNIVILGICGLLSIPVFMVPFLTSSRSQIAMVVIVIAIFMYYYKILKARQVLIGVCAIAVMVNFMGHLRTQNMSGGHNESTIIDSIVGSGNGLDLVRTAAIIEKVPDETPYLLGSSYLSLLTFYIPRSMWPGKPDVALGPWVKQEVFGIPVPGNNGWPSGLVAEAHMNFGPVGIPVALFLIGAFFRVVYNSVRPFLGNNFVLTLLYSFIAWRFSFGTTGLNFAHGMSQVLITAIPFMMFCLFVLKARSSDVYLAAAQQKGFIGRFDLASD